MLQEHLREDITAAQKSHDALRVGVLRFLSAQLQSREIEKRGSGQSPTLTDEETLSVFQKEVKKRKEAIELFRKGGRVDLVQKEEKELTYIEAYIPAGPTEEEIKKVVHEVIESGVKDFGMAMREVIKRFGGRADGAFVASLVKKELNA